MFQAFRYGALHGELDGATIRRLCVGLSDMFRRSASLAIPHRKKFAVIPAVNGA